MAIIIRCMQNYRFVRITVLLIFLTVMPVLQGDEIILTNGEQLSGTILTMDEESITLETYYGTVEIDRSKIRSGSFARKSDIPRTGLILELLYDDGIKDTSLALHSVNPVNEPKILDTETGNLGKGLYTDGSGQYVQVKTSDYLDKLNTMTISFWFTILDLDKYQFLLSKWESSRHDQAVGKISIGASRGDLYIYIVDSDGYYHLLRSNDIYGTNDWTHVIIQFSEGVLTLYINNSEKGQLAPGITALYNDTSPLYLMNAPSGKADSWEMYNVIGGMDNLRIYNRVLTQEERESLFLEG